MRRAAVPLFLILLPACGSQKQTPQIDGGVALPEAECSTVSPCPLELRTPTQGTIAAAGQVRQYEITIGSEHAGRRPIVQLQLDLPAVSPVRPVFSLIAPTTDSVMGSRGPQEGSGQTHLAANLLVPGPGTYELIVRDVDGHAADPRHPYTVVANVFDDPDSAEPDDDPAHARAAERDVPVSGFIAFSGDRDLVAFSMPRSGLSHVTLDQPAAGGALRLEARILVRSAQTPDNLDAATPVAEYQATQAGAALHVDVIRFLSPGDYVVALTDASGANADERPDAAWTLTISDTSEPDIQDQGGRRNDTAATATTIAASGTTMLQGLIGSQADRDWFHVALPDSTAAHLVEIAIDPQQANQDVQLLWAVGTKLMQPGGACDSSCGPTQFCSSGRCSYALHALRDYSSGDATPQVVRVRQQGAAQDIYVLIQDQGDDDRSTHPYALRVTVLPDPDSSEPAAANDSVASATPLGATTDVDGGVHYEGAGMISWWDFVDGRGTFQEPEDVDWFALTLPPRTPCDPNAPDAGSSCPAADGGPSYLPRPDYGLTMHWHGPADRTYSLGLQGVASLGGAGTACLFSFDQRIAHADRAGGYVVGNDPTDPCFCLPATEAENDLLWVRVDGPHRADPPAANAYSDLPYGFELDLTPGALPAACHGVCPAAAAPSNCP